MSLRKSIREPVKNRKSQMKRTRPAYSELTRALEVKSSYMSDTVTRKHD